ncbi:sugar ABC transporter substrate-binding protein [Anaerocolumna cellulosilytica]|uniref:Sugar ABC transporter substrate-binding protein n=1 Tax=Anaerocolumna cellulosilytica TaxID=433286 RepID=A0A6S6QTQ1_9FIRM|nr:extracellular solute-binding protein [Anaerocolumna cellulosilytica]MBB5197195.1 raffinose/stachyose/melibiose transport system substrate-binding protein [Anaerocolumna cellulosilytica]BCJ94004.1 sugar ABC transporter substrate-binding protein [Anaerocolumna cellulosilytica]
MKRKLMGIFLTGVLCITMLAGCSGRESGKNVSVNTGDTVKSNEEISLTMWTIATESDSFHQPYLDAIAEFEANHPGVTIQMETFENESYKTKIKAAVAANELPDIFFTWAGGFSQAFVESGKVLSLDDYYTAYASEITEAALANDMYNGKLYGSVTCTPISVMWYNKAMFEKQGVKVPVTWEEFTEVCQKFVDGGITPIGTSVKDTWVLAMLHDGLALKSAGPEKVAKALTKQGQSYEDEDFTTAAGCIRELVDMGAFLEGAAGLSNDEASAAFYAEQIPMYFTGSWMGGSIVTDAEKPENFSVAPIPVVNSTNASITDFMGGGSDTLMVSAATKYPDMAAAAAFEITRGVSKFAYLSGAGIPAWTVNYDTAEVPKLTQEVAALAGDATSYTLWFDTLMNSDDAGEYLSLLQALYTGDVTAEEFTKEMDAQLSR